MSRKNKQWSSYIETSGPTLSKTDLSKSEVMKAAPRLSNKTKDSLKESLVFDELGRKMLESPESMPLCDECSLKEHRSSKKIGNSNDSFISKKDMKHKLMVN